MTEVVFERRENAFLLTCSGHAGYAEKGKDIVCAGISALCAALEIALDFLHDCGAAESYFCTYCDGEFSAEAFAAEDATGVRTAFETVYGGLCRMAAEYEAHLVCRRINNGKEMTA